MILCFALGYSDMEHTTFILEMENHNKNGNYECVNILDSYGLSFSHHYSLT